MFKVFHFVVGVIAFIIVWAGLWASDANAGKFKFGADESVTKYATTGMTADGETKPLSLCYKANTYFFIGGLYTSDERVLCNDDQTLYWPVPSGARLAELQEAGHLPNPLPAYKRPVIEYAIGYSLWLILAAATAWTGIEVLRNRKDDTRESDDAGIDGPEETVT